MRLLCIGRHEYLSEHLCRVFSDLGAQCEPAVGIANALMTAGTFEPHLVVAESELLNPAVLDTCANEAALAGIPVLAVSLTRRPEESISADLCGLAGVIYLPTLDRASALVLLHGARAPRGVDIPPNALRSPSRQSAATH